MRNQRERSDKRLSICLALFFLATACTPRIRETESNRNNELTKVASVTVKKNTQKKYSGPEEEIKSLIEQLVFSKSGAAVEPLTSPGITERNSEYARKYEKCVRAFEELKKYAEKAFPYLIEHFRDRRQSIPFANHFMGQSVGDACYWNIYYQMHDTPKDYSEYGESRRGRDGKLHRKPYYEGTCFDEKGGVAKWLKDNEALSYKQKQIKCLSWLLEEEKEIGAFDAESYFINILPLEIRILERRLETGDNVENELVSKRRVIKERNERAVPADLLPDNKYETKKKKTKEINKIDDLLREEYP